MGRDCFAAADNAALSAEPAGSSKAHLESRC